MTLIFFLGAWKNDKPNGQGILTYANGDIYKGMFVDGKRHGQAKYKFHNGRTEKQNYRNDMQVKDETVSARQTATTASIHPDQLDDNRFSGIEELAD